MHAAPKLHDIIKVVVATINMQYRTTTAKMNVLKVIKFNQVSGRTK